MTMNAPGRLIGWLDTDLMTDTADLRAALGFTGSRGLGLITDQRKALIVDSRYTLQAHREVAPGVTVLPWDLTAVRAWLSEGDAFQYNPWRLTMSTAQWVRKLGIKLVPDWTDKRPPRHEKQHNICQPHPLMWAGQTADEKWSQLAGEQAHYVPAEDLGWLLNLRGQGMTRLVRMQGWAESGRLYVFSQEAEPQHVPDWVEWQRQEQWIPFLKTRQGSVSLSPTTTPEAVRLLLNQGVTVDIIDVTPIQRRKAVKDAAEQEGMRVAHHKDAQAWRLLIPEILSGQWRHEGDVVRRLEELRRQDPDYLGPSFSTIAARAAHSAIVHYNPLEQLEQNDDEGGCPHVWLIDAGAQYTQGTTDVTRTLWCGPDVDPEFARHYTAVLKGHIDLALAKFPKGTLGIQLDSWARRWLWEGGLDYGHATGHGVGAALNVHEYPPSLSIRSDKIPLAAGMILSNEPGVYLEGKYGIRLENLMVVVEEGGWLTFEMLTHIPFQTTCILDHQLDERHRIWLKHYQQSAAGI